MYSKTRTKLGIIYESCKLSGRLIAPLAKVEQSLAVRHIAEYVCRLAPAVRYCRARAETVGVEVDIKQYWHILGIRATKIVKVFRTNIKFLSPSPLSYLYIPYNNYSHVLYKLVN